MESPSTYLPGIILAYSAFFLAIASPELYHFFENHDLETAAPLLSIGRNEQSGIDRNVRNAMLRNGR